MSCLHGPPWHTDRTPQDESIEWHVEKARIGGEDAFGALLANHRSLSCIPDGELGKQGWWAMKNVAWIWLATLPLVAVHCGGGEMASKAEPAPGSSNPDPGQGAPINSGTTGNPMEPQLPPEQELEENFRVPVSTGRFVWTANPESNRVALIDAVTFGVVTLDAGFGPTYLAALPTSAEERSGAMVINEVSSDAHIFLAKDTTDVLTSSPIPVHPRANAWAVSDSGRWAIAWTHAGRIASADPTEGFQDITVIDLEDYPERRPAVTRLSVGYRPTNIVIADDDRRAYAVTEPGISVIELTGSGAPRVSRDITVSDRPAAEVAITPGGELALVRQANSAEINVVDLESGEQSVVVLPDVVTDLDLSQDASFAVAIVRGGNAADAEDGGGLAGAGGQGGDSSVGEGGAAGAPGQEPGASESLVAILPIPGIFVDPSEYRSVTIGELVGSVVVPASGENVLLYTNALPSDRVTILDTANATWRTVELKAAVQAVFATQNGEHAVALLSPPEASSKAGAFSLVPVARQLPPKLQGTLAPSFGVALVDAGAIVTTRDVASGAFEAYVAAFPSLRVDPVELPSAPMASGIVVDAGVAYVAQEHPEGRITFLDLEDARARTLTGFELGVKVVDGE